MATSGLNLSVPAGENRSSINAVVNSPGYDRGTVSEVGTDGIPMIKIKVSYGSNQFDLTVPCHSTFGDVKKVIAQEIGLVPPAQRLLFRGKEKEDQENLQMAGVKDNAKLLLMEDSTSNGDKLQEVKKTEEMSRGQAAVAEVSAVVNKLSDQVSSLQATICSGTQVANKEFVYLTEILMRQLLKLDSIEAEGEGKVHRKMEVCRVQSLVETIDTLKAKNCNQVSNSGNSVAVTTRWETFEPGNGNTALPAVPSAEVSHAEAQTQWATFESGVGTKAPTLNPFLPYAANCAGEEVQPATFHSSGVVPSLNGSAQQPSLTEVCDKQPEWHTFKSGVASHQNAPTSLPSSTKVTQDWEKFD